MSDQRDHQGNTTGPRDNNHSAHGGERPTGSGVKQPYRGGKPAYGAGKPGTRGDKPAYGAGKPGFRSDRPAGATGKPAFRSDRPAGATGKPAFRSDRPAGATGKPAFRSDRPAGATGKPAYRSDRPAGATGKPAYRSDRPAGATGKPAYRSDRPAGATGKPAFRSDRPAGAPGKPAYRSDRPAGATGKPAYRSDRPAGGGRPAFRHAPMAPHRPAKPVEPAAPAPTDGLPARRLALAVLREVTENGAYASLSLDEKLTRSGLSQADRRLASRLVYDTLEHLMYIDHALSQVMAKPDTDIKLRNILRLGACQILLEDRIPESAATNTSVNLCRELDMEGLVGVCNGILRNLVRKKDELSWPDPETEPTRAMSVKYSVPEWLVDRLVADWGRETAEGLMGCHEEDTYITVRPNLIDMRDEDFEALLDKKVWEHERGAVPHAWRIRGMADIGQDADFLGGHFSIQGEGSILACLALSPRRGMQVLDACAAPGGKACLIAEMMGGTGRVQAWELHEHRMKLIAAQAARLRLENVRPMTRDASVYREDVAGTMDAVLLDAPCSGLGVIADKPDVKMRVTEQSVAELTALQSRLLDSVSACVKPGGVMVYATCSVLKAENEDQVRAFLTRHPEFSLEKLPDTVPEAFRQYEDVGLQLMPQRDHTGGFYMARMRRAR